MFIKLLQLCIYANFSLSSIYYDHQVVFYQVCFRQFTKVEFVKKKRFECVTQTIEKRQNNKYPAKRPYLVTARFICGVSKNMIKSFRYNTVMSMHNSGMKCVQMYVVLVLKH